MGKTAAQATWGVCATVNEPEFVIRRFLEHYTMLGASEICLFVDGPECGLPKDLLANDKITVIPPGHSLPIETPPTFSHEQKQRANFSYYMNTLSKCDWVAHVDADELLVNFRGKMSMGAFLAAENSTVDSIRFMPAEAVFGPNDDIATPYGATLFRLPGGKLPRTEAALTKAYGPDRALLNIQGLVGHVLGKSMVRRGAKFTRITNHIFVSSNPHGTRSEREKFRLAHFDAVNFEQWQRKWSRRAQNAVAMRGIRGRREVVLERFVACGNDLAKQKALFQTLYMVTDRQMQILTTNKLLSPLNFDPQPEQETSPDGFQLSAVLRKSMMKTMGLFGRTKVKDSDTEAKLQQDTTARPKAKAKAKGKVKANEKLKKQQAKNRLENRQEDFHASVSSSIANGDFDGARATIASLGRNIFTDVRRQLKKSSAADSRRPVFLVGLHRSGTTLIEEHIVARYDVCSMRAKVPENEGLFLQDAMAGETAYGGPGLFGFFKQMQLTVPKSAAEIEATRLDILGSWAPWLVGDSDVFLEKSPPNLLRIEYLRTIFPGARFVVVVRDPRAVSLATQKWNKAPEILNFMHWCTSYAAAIESLSDDCMIVRYEDFCSDTNAILDKIGKFAELAPRKQAKELSARFATVSNTNQKYIEKFPELPNNLGKRNVFKVWEFFNYTI